MQAPLRRCEYLTFTLDRHTLYRCRHWTILRLWELLLHHCKLRLRKSKLHCQNPHYPLGKSWGESRSALPTTHRFYEPTSVARSHSNKKYFIAIMCWSTWLLVPTRAECQVRLTYAECSREWQNAILRVTKGYASENSCKWEQNQTCLSYAECSRIWAKPTLRQWHISR